MAFGARISYLTVVAGNWHTVGLKTDGHVVAIGDNRHG
ncbi:MAG: hypothetical protein GX825_01960 [Syntrophomonadaceae bacterium]|nr:hypothetical protein [Syntrophomonadaceae bacterium]